MSSAGWAASSMRRRTPAIRLVTPVDVSLWTRATALMACAAILHELRVQDVGVHAVPPVARHEVHVETEAHGHVAPQRGEVARLEHQHAIAGRQRVHERRFPRAGAGRRIDHNGIDGLEDALQPVDRLARHPRERGAAVVDGRLRDGAQHPVRHVGRPGDLQEVAAAFHGHASSLHRRFIIDATKARTHEGREGATSVQKTPVRRSASSTSVLDTASRRRSIDTEYGVLNACVA